MLPLRDLGRLSDMAAHARQAIALCEGLDELAFLADLKVCLACTRCCEIVGEAANGVSPATQESLSTIPWSVVIAFRNVLIHQYHKINYRIVFRTIRNDLPGLLKHIEDALSKNAPPENRA